MYFFLLNYMQYLNMDQAKEQYRQVTGRYKAGVGTAIELKDGENTYLNARLDFYNSILNYNLSYFPQEKTFHENHLYQL